MTIRVSTKSLPKILVGVMLAGLALPSLAGCASQNAAAGPSGTGSPASELRLGLFANVTHGPALIGVQEGLFAKELGSTKFTTQVFNAGPAELEALNASAIDAAYIGPSPAINSWVKSKGQSGVIVAGATNQGAQLVVRSGINSVADLRGKTLATPQLGNTQDIALRTYLKSNGYTTTTDGGGDVKITPTDNAQALQLFQKGSLDGAWLPEPWSSRFVLDAGAHVLVDEATLWPQGRFPTTVLLVNKQFAAAHPQTVQALLRGHLAAVNLATSDPKQAATDINAQLTKLSGKALGDRVLDRALKNVQFTVDPEAAAFDDLQRHAVDAGLAQAGSLNGLFQLGPLNTLLKADGKPAVSAAGKGSE